MSDFLKNSIRDVIDFPKKGIIFKDITTLLQNQKALQDVVNIFYEYYKDKNIDIVAGIEARGFIFAPILAYKLGVGFVPIRKPSKLPYKTVCVKYDLEYGSDEVCVHEDAFVKDANVLLLDDLIATGGTVAAACELIEKLGANVASLAFLVELEFLKGRERLQGYDIFSIIKY